MLVGDCQQLTQQAQEVVALKTYATEVDRFRDRQQKLATLAEELRPVVVAVKACRDRDLIAIDLSQKVDPILAEVATVLSEFQQDRG